MFRKLRAPLVALTATIACATVIASGDRSRLIPAPAVDEQAAPHGKQTENETIVLAGGCFWGVQGVFQHLKGVTNAVSGYAGGDEDSAHYERVSNGGTGHAESVSVTFDPKQVSLGRILQVYFSVAHDPTQLNRPPPFSDGFSTDSKWACFR